MLGRGGRRCVEDVIVVVIVLIHLVVLIGSAGMGWLCLPRYQLQRGLVDGRLWVRVVNVRPPLGRVTRFVNGLGGTQRVPGIAANRTTT